MMIWAAFAVIYLVWGSTYLAVTIALRSIPPFLLMGTRSVAGGLVLYACARLSGGLAPSARTWLYATGCGILFFVGCHGVLAYAQERVPSGMAAVLLATIPFWIVLLKLVLPGDDRPHAGVLALLIPGIAGVGLIAWQQMSSVGEGPSALDIALLIGAAASWALGTVLSERLQATSPVALSGMELVAGGLALIAIGFVAGEPDALVLADLTPASMLAWAYLTLAGTIVAFAAYVWLLRQVSPPLVATYTFVNPIIAVLLGWAVLGERPTVSMIVGVALVVASIAGLLWFSGQKAAAKHTERSSGRWIEHGRSTRP